MQLTIVGTGYVGLVSGTCFADTGNDVVCLDVDEQKIEMMRRGESPIYEPGLSDLLRRNIAAGRLTFTSDAEEAYREADFIFICVGTPSDDEGRADLQYVLGVRSIACSHIQKIDDVASRHRKVKSLPLFISKCVDTHQLAVACEQRPA